MIGVVEHSLEDTLPARSMGEGVCKAFGSFKTLLSIPDHYSSAPLLQQPQDLRAYVRPPLRGLQTKPRPLGVDSLLFQAVVPYRQLHPRIILRRWSEQ